MIIWSGKNLYCLVSNEQLLRRRSFSVFPAPCLCVPFSVREKREKREKVRGNHKKLMAAEALQRRNDETAPTSQSLTPP
jgi:hypothetical protein